MRLTVIGTGYLGATHAACLAELGFEVLGVDNDPEKIDLLSRGIVPFAEPGLDDLLSRHTRSGRLRFTTDLHDAASFADVHFVCVGTPQSPDGMTADLTAVRGVVRVLAARATRDFLVIGKSTVPVGTAHELALDLAARVPPGVTPTVAWNPEFLCEGHGVQDTLHPDRLVFGVTTPEAELALRRIYADPIASGVPLHLADWPEFGEIDPAWAGRLVSNRQVIDGRNTLDADAWRRAGWTFRGIGRGETSQRLPRLVPDRA